MIAATMLTPGDSATAGIVEDERLRRLGHAGLFAAAGLAAGVRYATSDAARRAPRAVLGAVLAALVLAGGGVEFGQHWVPERAVALGDALANIGGAVAGVLLSGPVMRRLFGR